MPSNALSKKDEKEAGLLPVQAALHCIAFIATACFSSYVQPF